MAEPRSARDTRRAAEDRVARRVFALCGALSVLVLLGIFLTLGANAVRAFTQESPIGTLTEDERALFTPEELEELESLHTGAPSLTGDFLGETTWRPDALKAPEYGILAMVASTLATTLVALLLAVPLGVAAAVWLAYRAGRMQSAVKFAIEMLAAVPSVVVGFIGIELIGPLVGYVFGVPGGLVALNGAILLAIMALPTIVSLSEDALSAVPRPLIDGALALGADRWQTIVTVALPAARSGLFAAVMLGMGRAIGETMTVLMVTGNAVAMPTSLLDPVRTMTATIAIELGEVPQNTTHYFMLFAVGLLLFLMTLGVNLAADYVQSRVRRTGG